MKVIYVIVLIFVSGFIQQQNRIIVTFPKISEPVQITKNGKEHLIASYYGINSFSKSEKYVTVLETDVKNHIPDENEPATLGLVS